MLYLRNDIVLQIQNFELPARRPETRLDGHELLLVQRQLLERRNDALVVLGALPDEFQGHAVHALLRRRVLVLGVGVGDPDAIARHRGWRPRRRRHGWYF